MKYELMASTDEDAVIGSRYETHGEFLSKMGGWYEVKQEGDTLHVKDIPEEHLTYELKRLKCFVFTLVSVAYNERLDQFPRTLKRIYAHDLDGAVLQFEEETEHNLQGLDIGYEPRLIYAEEGFAVFLGVQQA